MKISTLRTKAQRTTKARGHRMKWGQPFGNATTQHFGQHGRCRDCYAEVWLDDHPAPNSCGISGPAVSVNCKQPSVN